jgi:hypothetical protein
MVAAMAVIEPVQQAEEEDRGDKHEKDQGNSQ